MPGSKATAERNQHDSSVTSPVVVPQDNSDSTSNYKISEIGMTAKAQLIDIASVKNSTDQQAMSSPRREEIVLESELIVTEDLLKCAEYREKGFPGSLYLGQVVDGKRQGLGIMRYQNGRQYEGSWLDDKRHGQGYERFSKGNSYFGSFENGLPQGKGVYNWANGELYDGEWKKGLKHGYGIWRGLNDESYLGEWQNSRAHGHGIHTWKTGDRYEGQWVDGLKHGGGTDFYSNGDSYTGEFQNGKATGKGQIDYHNGSSYNGHVRDGIRHGKGKWKSGKGATNINKYEGDYANDKREGVGNFTWASGNYYKGDFKADERHGYGEMHWGDNSCYQGDWKKGVQHGRGRMIFPDGSIQEGQFENNTYKVHIEISSEAQAKEMEQKIGEFRSSVSPRLTSQPQSTSSQIIKNASSRNVHSYNTNRNQPSSAENHCTSSSTVNSQLLNRGSNKRLASDGSMSLQTSIWKHEKNTNPPKNVQQEKIPQVNLPSLGILQTNGTKLESSSTHQGSLTERKSLKQLQVAFAPCEKDDQPAEVQLKPQPPKPSKLAESLKAMTSVDQVSRGLPSIRRPNYAQQLENTQTNFNQHPFSPTSVQGQENSQPGMPGLMNNMPQQHSKIQFGLNQPKYRFQAPAMPMVASPSGVSKINQIPAMPRFNSPYTPRIGSAEESAASVQYLSSTRGSLASKGNGNRPPPAMMASMSKRMFSNANFI